jgi:type IX secretion system PorP/SprF family membrane protein
MRKESERHVFCLLTLCLLVTMVIPVAGQQSPQFTQFMFNNMVMNPAYAGAEEALSATLLTRSQWTGVENAPSTQCFSAHTLLEPQQLGLGLAVIRDRIGVHSHTNIRTNYAYHLPVRKDAILSVGLQAGVTMLKSDYASLLGNSGDPKLMSSLQETMLGLGAGVYYRTTRWCAGLSVPELLSRNVTVQDSLTVHLQRSNVLGYARYSFVLNKSFDLEPGILIKHFANVPMSVDLNVNVVYKKVLTGGLSYRSKESVDVLMRFQLTPQLQFGYAYDHPVSFAGRISSASHELMVSYLFRNIQRDVASPR